MNGFHVSRGFTRFFRTRIDRIERICSPDGEFIFHTESSENTEIFFRTQIERISRIHSPGGESLFLSRRNKGNDGNSYLNTDYADF